MEWVISKSTKKCTSCSKMFGEGEEYFSALFWNKSSTQKNTFVRQDYCISCWKNRPPEVFSFWKTRMITKERPKPPKEILVEFFDNLMRPEFQPQPDNPIAPEIRQKVIYLFSLILLRKKILRIKENIYQKDQPFIIFERTSDGKLYEVAELTISENELISLQNEFSRLFEFDIS